MKHLSTKLTMTTALVASLGISIPAFAGGHPGYEPDLVPSGATPGQCYARVKIPAQYSTTRENVLVEEGYSTVEVSQPQLASRQEEVLVKEASVRYEVRQPRYKTVSEQMLVRPAYDKLSVSAPQFKTVTEKVQISAPRVVWKRGNPGRLAAQGYTILSVADAGQQGRGYSSTTQYGASGGATRCGEMCEIWCLVEEPGETMSVQRKVMTSPGQVRRTTVPAKYTNITKQVVADPGGVREIPIPAEYRNVTVEDIVDPGGERYVDVAPKYAGIDKKVLIAPERYEWRRVVCQPGTMRSGTTYSSGTTYGSGYSSSSSTMGQYTGGTQSGTASHTYGSASNTLGSYESSGRVCTGSSCSGGHSQQGSTYYYGTDKPVNHHRHKSGH
ncbi:MAG TPA: hypothetical protein ENJ42_06355 [Hellea balneolensis]|uniref:Uncharacterized protein n=1 Tax=Hellea balneolensis TaxID=287478 RepID=A0A7C5QWM0_9PROT|nr:hypothetical protein [Hellea balneolensis]